MAVTIIVVFLLSYALCGDATTPTEVCSRMATEDQKACIEVKFQERESEVNRTCVLSRRSKRSNNYGCVSLCSRTISTRTASDVSMYSHS